MQATYIFIFLSLIPGENVFEHLVGQENMLIIQGSMKAYAGYEVRRWRCPRGLGVIDILNAKQKDLQLLTSYPA